MKVRINGSTRIHTDIPPAIVALLQDAGINLLVVRDGPAPLPQVSWGVKETSTGKIIVRNDGLGNISFHDSPPEGCPLDIALQLDRPSELDKAHAESAHLERARNAQADHDGRIQNARRW